MTENSKESKKYKYLVTMRWYVETDEDLVAGSAEADEKLLNMVRHQSNGKPCSPDCPTRNQEGYGILDYHHFMGDKKNVYLTSDQIKD